MNNDIENTDGNESEAVGKEFFEHETIRIDAISDPDNAKLFELRKVEILELPPGQKRGRGKATGKFKKKWVFVGFYPSFKTALRYGIDLLVRKGKNVSDLQTIIRDLEKLLIPIVEISMTTINNQIKEKYQTRASENEKIRNGEKVSDGKGGFKKRRGKQSKKSTFKLTN